MKRNTGSVGNLSNPRMWGGGKARLDVSYGVHRDPLNTENGARTSPNSVPSVGYSQGVPTPPTRIDVAQTLADNVQKLLDDAAARGKTYGTMKGLAKRAGIGATTIRRILDKDGSPRVDNVDAIARVFGLQAYQLLLPDWPVSNPPVIPYTETEKRLYRGVAAMAKELALPGGAHEHDESPDSDPAANPQVSRSIKARKARKRRPVAKT